MVTKTEDVIRLRDMTRSISEVIGYVGNTDYNKYSLSENKREAIMAELSQIGGAAALLTDEFKEEHGEIDWDVLKGLQYSNADQQLELDLHPLLYLVKEDLPEINEQLNDLITELEDDQDIEGVTLNEEDRHDVEERYKSKEARTDARNQNEDIRYEDETPHNRGEEGTDSPEENYIESSEQRRGGPFNP